jgi:hypothetical protein
MRRPKLRTQLLWLQLSLLGVALSLLFSILNLREGLRDMDTTQHLRIARATCQSLFYASGQAEHVSYEAQGPTCTLTFPKGVTVVFRWEDTWWVRDKRL